MATGPTAPRSPSPTSGAGWSTGACEMSTFAGLNTALSALRINRVAMDVASGDITNGGQVPSIDRMADPLLDIRARREHGNQSYLDIRQSVLERVESGVGEPSDTGVAAAIADFRSAWHDLAN